MFRPKLDVFGDINADADKILKDMGIDYSNLSDEEKRNFGLSSTDLLGPDPQSNLTSTGSFPGLPQFTNELSPEEQERVNTTFNSQIVVAEAESERMIKDIRAKGKLVLASAQSFLNQIGSLGRTISGAPVESMLGLMGRVQGRINNAIAEEERNLGVKLAGIEAGKAANVQDRIDALNELRQTNFVNAFKIFDAAQKQREFNATFLQKQEEIEFDREKFEKIFGLDVDALEFDKIKFAVNTDLSLQELDLMEAKFLETARTNGVDESLAINKFQEDIRRFNLNYEKGNFDLVDGVDEDGNPAFVVFDKETGNFWSPSTTRADRHANPLAMMFSDRWAGLMAEQGIEVTAGDQFPDNPNFRTMRFKTAEEGILGARIIWDDMESRFGDIGTVLDNWSGRTAAVNAGINPAGKWSELNEDDKNKLMQAQMKIEGFNQGRPVEIRPKSGKAKDPNPTQITGITDLDSGIAGMFFLLQEAPNFADALGPTQLRALSSFARNVFDPEFAAFAAEVDKIFQIYRKVTTGAQASDKELARLLPLLPKVTDTPETFNRKSKATLESYKLKRDMMLSNMQKSGIDVSQYDFEPINVDSLEEMKARVDQVILNSKLEGDTINVKLIETGEVGTVIIDDFNPATMELI